MADLIKRREEIDQIDQAIVELFERRMKIAEDVATYKIAAGKEVQDKKREEEKLEMLENLVCEDRNKSYVQELYTQILSMSRKLQYTLMPDSITDRDFECQPELNISEDTKVVFFGIRGTYTEQAMEEYFGRNIKSCQRESFKEVMQMVELGEADFGVLPIENSSTGGITDIYDLLVDYNIYIVGGHVVNIDNTLMGLEGASIEGMQRVYSHAQPLMQCADFLEEHRHMQPIDYFSTAASARKVAEDGDITQGAIAGKRAAEFYGLKVLKERINRSDTNSTRFIIITNKKMFLKSASKVSVCFELPDERGSLYNILSHFLFNNLNLVMIESRPILGKKWEYRFFVDVEGSLNHPGMKNALRGIQSESVKLKILGNF